MIEISGRKKRENNLSQSGSWAHIFITPKTPKLDRLKKEIFVKKIDKDRGIKNPCTIAMIVRLYSICRDREMHAYERALCD